MPVDKSQQRIRRMFGAIAPRYDRMNRLMTFGLDRRWRNRTVRSVPTDPAEPVLDVCCGTGALALAWALAGAWLVPRALAQVFPVCCCACLHVAVFL